MSAQIVTGSIVDKDTHKPMPYILISATGTNVFTSEQGAFSIQIKNVSDTLHIKTMGYKPLDIPVTPFSGRLKLIELIPQSIRLSQVTISAYKRYLQDSIDNRRQFAKEFAFKGPVLTDMMHHSSTDAPFAFVNVDLISIFKAINKKKTPQYHLQQYMINSEKYNHVALRFNRGLVSQVTRLKGDSLNTFMTDYRPPQSQIDAMTDYNLITFIKESYKKFQTRKPTQAPTQIDFKKDTVKIN
ncbi:carboxypeptidase-like regulatory domain-containing protein [Mucilaginibacter litoreus]|uniref:Carboxypeptidase-like regulatory domain-containing protein n=1 Tax=Mucilaginibacter litoreus TaxID=1048221 RepID=A0ABW3AP47_9SPHI